MEIVFVNIGVFQHYILDTIHQAWIVGNKKITVICEDDHFTILEEFMHSHPSHLSFKIVSARKYATSPLFNTCKITGSYDPHFRNDFWNKTWDRFIILYEYMNDVDATNIIHIENDIMVYVAFDEISSIFNQKSVYLTMDNPNRCVPAVMYIRSSQFLREHLLQPNYIKDNDMMTLGDLAKRKPEDVGRLSIIPSQSDYVFDAAALGQYLGGIDPRNTTQPDTRGYVSTDCMFANYSKWKYKWIRHQNQLWYPYLVENDKSYPIANLHIHSKKCKRFSSWFPMETHLIPLNHFDKVTSIIQGEKIEELCPIFVGEQSDVEFNPLIRPQTTKHFIPEKEKMRRSLWNPPLIFCYLNVLHTFLSEFGAKLQNPCIIICHNTDYTIRDKEIRELDALLPAMVKAVFSQNLDTKLCRDRWYPLPIGLQNTQWLSTPISEIFSLQDTPKSNNVYLNFSIHTNQTARNECLSALASHLPWTPSMSPHAEYWKMLSSHKASVCPIGNGVDTHRLWESLLLNVVPITLRHPYIERLCETYPDLKNSLMIIENWEEARHLEIKTRRTMSDCPTMNNVLSIISSIFARV